MRGFEEKDWRLGGEGLEVGRRRIGGWEEEERRFGGEGLEDGRRRRRSVGWNENG